MSEIVFSVTEDGANALTWADLEALMRGDIVGSRSIIARFLVDENGAPVPYEQAYAQLGKLKISEIKNAVEVFGAAMRDAAVPPTSADK